MEEVNKHESLSKHPNCVEFHKAWAEKGHLYIQTELCKMRSVIREVSQSLNIHQSVYAIFAVSLL